MYIPRSIESDVQKWLFRNKTITIYGARQAGKTTLVQHLARRFSKTSTLYLNCDEDDRRDQLTQAGTSTQLKQIIGNNKLIIIDEAQRVENIGLKLKLLVDNYPDQQIIATGSSSFDLSNKISEPLTGRAIEYWLHPFSLAELQPKYDIHVLTRRFEELLLYGTYPTVFCAPSIDEKRTMIQTISRNYLYKDILALGSIRNADIIQRLLQALALQIGNEVSYNELASLLGMNKDTVASYIAILEQAFIIFHLPPFSRNLRKELGKLRKIYFYDLGVRNSLIRNFNPLQLRNDIGALWENFVIAEVKKRENSLGNLQKLYFWRTYDKQEINLVVDIAGKLHAYEIKWKKSRKKAPKAWTDGYPDATWQVITRQNLWDSI